MCTSFGLSQKVKEKALENKQKRFFGKYVVPCGSGKIKAFLWLLNTAPLKGSFKATVIPLHLIAYLCPYTEMEEAVKSLCASLSLLTSYNNLVTKMLFLQLYSCE